MVEERERERERAALYREGHGGTSSGVHAST